MRNRAGRALGMGMLLLALASFKPAVSDAQTFRPDVGAFRSLTPAGRPVAYADGRGLRLGDFTLHPGVTLGAGFDSNVFFEEDREGIESAPTFTVMPSLRLDTPDPRALRIISNLQLLWELYASEDEDVSGQSGFDVLGDLGVQIGPRGLLSVTLYDVLRRFTDSPSAPSLESRNHLYNEVGALLGFHPGGSDRRSRMGFTGELGAGYGLEIWDEELGLDRQLVLTRLVVRYFFLPRTAAFVNASWDFVAYEQAARDLLIDDEAIAEDPILASFEGALQNVDSAPLRVTGGVSGLLTRAIDFRLEGGYGRGGYDSGPDYSSYLAHVGAGVFFTPQARLAVGWKHDFFDSSFSNFYELDRLYAEVEVTLRDWMVGLEGGFELQRFAPLESPDIDVGSSPVALYSTNEREDPVLDLTTYVAWNYLEWARLTAYYRFRGNFSEFVVTTGQPSGPDRPNSAASEYMKHEIFFVTEFEY